MSPFKFRPSARLQKYLGQELIADPNLAIIEFVKNAYDAGAANVFLDFRMPKSGDASLTISDDGCGMDQASFEANWMHPGFSEKALIGAELEGQPPKRYAGRVPVGEKGLGRLSAARLGSKLEVFTRTADDSPWLHVTFDWAAFDNMRLALQDVNIPFDHKTSPPAELRVSVGTVLVISGLHQDWNAKVLGRPVPGRRRTKLGRLRQDLELLVRPLGANDPGFSVHLDSDSIREETDIGTVTPAGAAAQTDYRYEFEFKPSSGGDATISRTLHRSKALVDEFGGKRKTSATVRLSDTSQTEDRPATLEAGPFKGQFFYSPAPAAKRAREVDAVGFGVLLYRDGVLVEPYGMDGNDWVGVAAKKASRQGYALVQPNLFSGYVLITRELNPDLRDMSNRQGLLDTEATEEFIRHIQAEFLQFDSLVFAELKKRWETKDEKDAEQAKKTIDLAAVRLRAIAHSMGQPLGGLEADVASIRIVAKRSDIPDDAARDLGRLVDSAANHLRRARESLSRFRDVPAVVRTDVAVADLAEAAAESVAPLAQSLGVGLVVEDMPGATVRVHRELMVEALGELLRNSVEADRANGSAGVVSLSAFQDQGDVVLVIADDGAGVEEWATGDFSAVESTKGRPGMGLATVQEIVTASLGKIAVLSSDAGGTRIEVRLSDRLSGTRTSDR